jgi:hypothetical protein
LSNFISIDNLEKLPPNINTWSISFRDRKDIIGLLNKRGDVWYNVRKFRSPYTFAREILGLTKRNASIQFIIEGESLGYWRRIAQNKKMEENQISLHNTNI